MTHKEKDPRFTNPSSRLDALLADFLNREIEVPPEADTGSGKASASPETLPLTLTSGSRDANVASPSEPQLSSRKIGAVERTDLWETSNRVRSTHLPAGLTDDPMGNLARLEKGFQSAIAAPQAGSQGRRVLLFVALAMIFASAGFYYWKGSRRHAAHTEQAPGQLGGFGTQDSNSAEDSAMGEGTRSMSNPASSGGESRSGAIEATPRAPGAPVQPRDEGIEPLSRSTTTESKKADLARTAPPAAAEFALAPETIGPSLPLSAVQSPPGVRAAQPPVPLPLPVPSVAFVPPQAPAPGRTANFQVAGIITAAMALVKVRPVYPEVARRMNVSGTVEVSIVVDQSGRVVEARALSGPHLLRGSAEAALKQWRFRPAMLNEKPAIGVGKVAVVFHKPQH